MLGQTRYNEPFVSEGKDAETPRTLHELEKIQE